MAITIYLGNLGSGKTASAVRYMSKEKLMNYSNILCKLDNVTTLKPEMIVTKEDKNYKLNLEFWKQAEKPCNVVLDEAHSIIDARRSMSKLNIVINDWLSMLRRILGSSDMTGDLILISQLSRRLDTVCREMATNIKYHICHYFIGCRQCGQNYYENSDMAEKLKYCPSCNGIIRRYGHYIEVLEFIDIEHYEFWKYEKEKCYFKRYYVKDIAAYFPLYDTLQWDNLFSNLKIR